MTIRFAARAGSLAPRLDRSQVRAVTTRPVNDNYAVNGNDAVLSAALRHFANFGMAAAQDARGRAESALQAEDAPGYEKWLAICRVLDRTLAAKINALDHTDATGSRLDLTLTSR